MNPFNVWTSALGFVEFARREGNFFEIEDDDFTMVGPGFGLPSDGMMLVHAENWDEPVNEARHVEQLERYLLARTAVAICPVKRKSKQNHKHGKDLLQSNAYLAGIVHEDELEDLPGLLCPMQLSRVWKTMPDFERASHLDAFFSDNRFNLDRFVWLPPSYRRHAAGCLGCERSVRRLESRVKRELQKHSLKPHEIQEFLRGLFLADSGGLAQLPDNI